MRASSAPTREQAARLLGVGLDAVPAEVKRAFRLWAAWAHPDQGGSAERFAELCAARDRLLASDQPVAAASRRTRPRRRDVPPAPRRPWHEVLVRPTPLAAGALCLAALACIASVGLALVLPLPWSIAPAAVAAAAWCVAVSRVVLRGADHGHVIVTRSAAWAAVVAGQLIAAWVAGIALVEVLPLLAVPFVAVIAAVNPAAGLWRSASR